MLCDKTIEFGDDYGDNTATFHCKLKSGHSGPHQEMGDMGWPEMPIPYSLTWTGSEEELLASIKLEEERK